MRPLPAEVGHPTSADNWVGKGARGRASIKLCKSSCACLCPVYELISNIQAVLPASTVKTVPAGCVAFGIDRLAVALFALHGVEISKWPSSVRAGLGV